MAAVSGWGSLAPFWYWSGKSRFRSLSWALNRPSVLLRSPAATGMRGVRPTHETPTTLVGVFSVLYRPCVESGPGWGNRRRRGSESVALSGVAILAVGRRGPVKRHGRRQVMLSSWRPNSRLPELLKTVELESNLHQNGRPLHPLSPLCRRQDCSGQLHDTSTMSSRRNRETTFEDAVNIPLGDAFRA